MPEPLVMLSQDDIKYLKDFIDNIKRLQKNTPLRQRVNEIDVPTPEVYLVYTPFAGIPANVGLTTGTTSDDTLGYADCNLYRTIEVSGTRTVVPLGITKRIYNLSPVAISGQTWILAVKDKFGLWTALPISADHDFHYIAWTGVSGIGALGQGAGTGTAMDDVPGSAILNIYKITSGPKIETAHIGQLVYNMGLVPLPSHAWVLVHKDTYGSWIATTADASILRVDGENVALYNVTNISIGSRVSTGIDVSGSSHTAQFQLNGSLPSYIGLGMTAMSNLTPTCQGSVMIYGTSYNVSSVLRLLEVPSHLATDPTGTKRVLFMEAFQGSSGEGLELIIGFREGDLSADNTLLAGLTITEFGGWSIASRDAIFNSNGNGSVLTTIDYVTAGTGSQDAVLTLGPRTYTFVDVDGISHNLLGASGGVNGGTW